MNRDRLLLIGVAAATLALAGGGVAAGWQDAPAQDAVPAPDPVGDALRAPSVQEAAPSADPAPANPFAITPLSPPVTVETEARADDPAAEETLEEEVETGSDGEGESQSEKAARLAADTPAPRQRRRVAIVEAIDKITAESMRFEVEVGGRPVRFNQSLIFTARACEVSADSELVDDAIAYLDVALQPRGAQAGAPRQIFRGWMFASTPALSGLQHPIYDAWIVGCKA